MIELYTAFMPNGLKLSIAVKKMGVDYAEKAKEAAKKKLQI